VTTAPFVCFVPEDTFLVDELASELAQHGVGLDYDRELPAVAATWPALLGALDRAQLVVAVVSAAALDSFCFHRATARVAAAGRPLLAIRTGGVGDEQVPQHLASVANLDLGAGSPGEVAVVAASIREAMASGDHRVFISYRRDLSQHAAGRLAEQMRPRLGRNNVFMDVEDIEPGIDFVDAITSAISICNVLLAIIGPRWATITDDEGRRRLDDATDYVALELAVAFEQGVRVIPVLLDGTPMPRIAELPTVLHRLARLQAARLDHPSFHAQAEQLITLVEHLDLPAR
jgi:hypothetical protein